MLNENTHSDSAMSGAIYAAVSDVMNSPKFIHNLAEELADMLAGFDDEVMLRHFHNANNGELASEDEVFSALRTN